MANTHICYETSSENGSKSTLCFICATQLALQIDPKKSTIRIVSTSWDFEQCENCKEFIRDEISI